MKKLSILLLMIFSFVFALEPSFQEMNKGTAPDYIGSAPMYIADSTGEGGVGTMDIGYTYNSKGGGFIVSYFIPKKDGTKVLLYRFYCEKPTLNTVIDGFSRAANEKLGVASLLYKQETMTLSKDWGLSIMDMLVVNTNGSQSVQLNCAKMSKEYEFETYFVESDVLKIHQKAAVVDLFNKAIAHQLKQIEARKVN